MAPSTRKPADARKQVASRLRAYFAALPPDARRELKKIRGIIRAAAPEAEEDFAYGIPAFRLEGQPFLYYAAWRKHTSLYPMTAALRRAHAKELKGYVTSKGTVQFPLDEPLPAGFVKRLARSRRAEMRAKAKA